MSMPAISDLQRWGEATGCACESFDLDEWRNYWGAATGPGMTIGQEAIDWIAANPAPEERIAESTPGVGNESEKIADAVEDAKEYLRTFPSSRARVPDELIPARMACISADMRMGAEWWKRRP
jgi:hypothetical protein